MLFPRERSVFFCEAGNRSIDLQVQRIRIILWSVKLRVLNPKLQKQRNIRGIKQNDTSQTKHANIIENVCFFSRASGRFATQEGARFHRRRFEFRFWSSSTSSRVSGG